MYIRGYDVHVLFIKKKKPSDLILNSRCSKERATFSNIRFDNIKIKGFDRPHFIKVVWDTCVLCSDWSTSYIWNGYFWKQTLSTKSNDMTCFLLKPNVT